ADPAAGDRGQTGATTADPAGIDWAGATMANPAAGDLSRHPGQTGTTTADSAAGNPSRRSDRTGATTADPAAGDLGWCSGLAGRVLAMAATPGFAGPRSAARAADAFSAAVAARPPSVDQSLCHGELGTLEALVVLAGQGHEPSVSALRRAASRLVGAVEGHGLQCGTPHGVASPGLLTGTGGIGFGLLRVGFAERVPSVLLLEPSGHQGK
ncbi:lanthionine synthetase LanC family protein, partial [Amycolatopsis sp.]|uniref:lanthionine synthetase LanC family protein n=1 Tax=Amycolatopsis sp. TaxID=37632 RepID=UPI002D7FA196